MIYTSYYSNPSIRKIPDSLKLNIALYRPRWLSTSIRNVPALYPPEHLLRAIKSGAINWEQYKDTYYREVLNTLDPRQVYDSLKGKTLLCYCKGVCHRNIVAEWLESNGCGEVKEL